MLRAQKETTFSSAVKVVNVLATVRNKQGQIVQNLTKDDFSLQEDGRPQTIRYFSRETDLPLTLGLLVDTSLSQRRVLEQERTASYRFLDQVLREDKDLAFVIHFDREVELLQDLTPSRKKLESALQLLQTPEIGRWGGRRGGGGTSLYDSVLLASDELMKKQGGRKALIMLSGGVDHGSKVPLTQAVEAAQRADTLVYSILFSDAQAYGEYPGGYPRMGRRGSQRRRMPPPQAREQVIHRTAGVRQVMLAFSERKLPNMAGGQNVAAVEVGDAAIDVIVQLEPALRVDAFRERVCQQERVMVREPLGQLSLQCFIAACAAV